MFTTSLVTYTEYSIEKTKDTSVSIIFTTFNDKPAKQQHNW